MGFNSVFKGLMTFMCIVELFIAVQFNDILVYDP